MGGSQCNILRSQAEKAAHWRFHSCGILEKAERIGTESRSAVASRWGGSGDYGVRRRIAGWGGDGNYYLLIVAIVM